MNSKDRTQHNGVNICIRYELLPGNGVLERLQNAVDYGFEGVSLPGRFLNTFIDDFIRLKSKIPIPLVSMSLGYEGSLVSPDLTIRKRCRESLVELFDRCAELNMDSVNMPPILTIFSEHRHTNVEVQDRLLLDQLFELTEESKKRDLYLLLEPVNRYETDYMNTLTHAAGIAEAINHSHLGISADFFHMQIEELNIPDSISQAGKWIKHVHVAENTRVEPGPGSLDFKPGFRALKNVGYDKYIEIEARSLSGEAAVVLPKAIAYLQNLWAIS